MNAAIACAPAEPPYEVRRWQKLVRDCADLAPGCIAAVTWSDARRAVLRIGPPPHGTEFAPNLSSKSLSVLAHRATPPLPDATPPPISPGGLVPEYDPNLMISKAEFTVQSGRSDSAEWEILKKSLLHRRHELEALLKQSILLLDLELQTTRLMMVIELLTAPTMLLDEDTHPRFFNAAARELLAEKRRVSISAHHQIVLPDDAKNREFKRLVKTLANGERRSEGPVVLRYQSLDRETLDFVRLSAIPSMANFTPHNPAIASGSVKVEFITPRSATSLSNKSIQNIFDMTAAEAKLAAALCDGLTLDSYAEREGIAISTVRWHLHNLLSRTETRSQAELIRLLLTVLR